MSADGSYTYTLPSGTSAMFTTQKLSSFPAPVFGSLKPKQGIPRAKFTISGSHFGDAQGLGTVRFGKLFAEIDSWSDTSISAYVPSGLPVGTYKLSVNGAGGADAGGASFDVIDLGPALSRTGWTATTSDTSPYNDGPANMLDGNSDTRYSSGTGQYDGLWIQVDMGQTQTFDKILLHSGSNIGDYAPSADVYVYVKVVNTGNVASNWWAIAEFTIYKRTCAVLNSPLSGLMTNLPWRNCWSCICMTSPSFCRWSCRRMARSVLLVGQLLHGPDREAYSITMGGQLAGFALAPLRRRSGGRALPGPATRGGSGARLVLMLRRFSGITSYQEIADVCEVPVGTVRSRLNQARGKPAQVLLLRPGISISGRKGYRALQM